MVRTTECVSTTVDGWQGAGQVGPALYPRQGADGRMGPQPVHMCCVDLEKGELLQKSGVSVQYSPCEDVDFCSTRPAESQTGGVGGVRVGVGLCQG